MADPRYTASGSFRVRPHRPWRNVILGAIALAALGAGGWALYELGLRHGGYEARMARATEAHLRIDVEELRDRVSKLAQRNTLLERAERIEREARERLRGVIEAREGRIAQLQEELAFYRNLVSPSEMEPGLHIRRLSLRAVDGAARLYEYELVLTQINSSDRYVSGRIDLSVRGRRGGDAATVELADLATDEEPETEFRFKYFQTLTGRISVPQGVEPDRLRLRVAPSGGRLESLEEDYSWDSLLSGGQ
ncbi:MAG: DUF6776 family protein [Halofilum sp. (in: g-proteobacteria)]|nr:DUF6776 family protein [Halofilum sp. (in: g-proteobacteria)]